MVEELTSRLSEKSEQNHVDDALNLFLYLILMCIVVVTIWALKHYRLRYVHETGLAIIYGLIVGAIIQYGTGKSFSNVGDVHLMNSSEHFNSISPPDVLMLTLPPQNLTYRYNYKSRVDSDIPPSEQELDEKASFDPEVFFNIILPPIIFNAGYSMKRRHFFRNFGAITVYAFIGTTVSAFVIGSLMFGFTRLLVDKLVFTFSDALFFGSLISATDPVTVLAIFHDLNVDVDLYALVFGESVLNDAVAIVLSGTIQEFDPNHSTSEFDTKAFFLAILNFFKVFVGAFGIGSLFGIVTALVTKYTRLRDFPILETALFLLLSFASYQLAEACKLTGIVAVLFCGICQAHYTYNNLSDESKVRTKQLFDLLNFLMENFVFTYIGVTIFTRRDHIWEVITVWFILAALLAIFIGRALNVYPLSALLNLGRSKKITYNFQHMMMFSGLRGAVAFALASRTVARRAQRMILTATLVIVIITVIFCGGLTMQMLYWLKINVGVQDETETSRFESQTNNSNKASNYNSMDSPGSDQSGDALQSPVDSPSQPVEKAWLVQKWYNVDTRFVKPLLTHSRPTLEQTLPGWCQRLARLLTTDEQRLGIMTNDSDDELILEEGVVAFGDTDQSAPRDSTGTLEMQEESQLGDLGLGSAVLPTDGMPMESHTDQTGHKV